MSMLVGISFAQKKAVKEAKKLMGDDKLTEARQMLNPALSDPETAADPETWKIAGDIEGKAFDNEQKKIITGKQPNEEVMYSALYDAWNPYITADSLSRIPDKKGKVSDKYRKDIASIMKFYHLHFINGGVYYNNKKDFKKATDFFERYWNTPSLKVFDGYPEKDKINTNDTTFQTIKYYAAICAIQGKEHERAIGFLTRILDEPYTENSNYQKNEVYELLANEYVQTGDSTKYIDVLREGSKLFPKSKYFVPNLINEMIKRQKMDEALTWLDQAIANDPENACELYSVKASIYTQESKFDESFDSYEKALAADGNCERALEGLAVAYIVKAQDLKEKATQSSVSRKEQSEIDAQANDLYKKACPLLEKLRTLLEKRKAESIEPVPTTREIKGVLYKLRNAYYNLNMNAEYETITKIYEEMDE
jgi:tetratricopeptide (TPR) repeat protein